MAQATMAEVTVRCKSTAGSPTEWEVLRPPPEPREDVTDLVGQLKDIPEFQAAFGEMGQSIKITVGG